MSFQQAFQQALLLSCSAADAANHATQPQVSAEEQRQFSVLTRYRKSSASLSWTIDDFSVRDANEEALAVVFAAGEGAEESRWKLQCFFGCCPDEHKDFLCLSLDLVSPGEPRSASLEISLVTPDGRKPCFKRLKCHKFMPGQNTSGIHSKVTRNYLIDNAAQLVPCDKLTVQCKLSVYGQTSTTAESAGVPVVTTEETTPRQTHAPTRLGRDLGRLLGDGVDGGGAEFGGGGGAADAAPSTSGRGNEDDAGESAAGPSRTHSDVTLRVQGGVFRAHKAILAARSAVFARMFDADMIEQSSNEVVIEDFDAATMKPFLRYIYTGQVGPLTVQLAKDLFSAADKYEVPELKSLCETFMGRNLTADNVAQLLVLAHLHDCKDLKTRSLEFFASSAHRVLDSAPWESLAAAYPDLVTQALRALAKRQAPTCQDHPPPSIPLPGPSESPKKKMRLLNYGPSANPG